MLCDQKQHNTNGGPVAFGGSTWRPQTFALDHTGDILDVYVPIRRDSTGVTGNLVCEIRATTGSVPNTTILATSAAVDATILYTDKNRWCRFHFASPYAGVAGTLYGLNVKPPAGGGTSDFRCYYADANHAYPNGQACVTTDGGANFDNDPSADYAFMVFTNATETAPTLPDSPYGAVSHLMWDNYTQADIDHELDLAQAAGIKYLRFDVGWVNLEPYQGSFPVDYVARLDYAVDACVARGIEPVLMQWLCPDWAASTTTDPPTDMAYYGDYLRHIAAMCKGRVHVYEMWNEPNLSAWWTGTAAQFKALAQAGYAGIKDADPNAIVILGGLNTNDTTYLASLYTAGIAHGTTHGAIGVHPYCGSQSPAYSDADPEKEFGGISDIRAVMTTNSDTSDIWLTEIGWSSGTAGDGVGTALQATYLADMFAKLADYSYVKVACWYSVRNEGEVNAWDQYGLLRTDFAKKPSYTAYGVMTGMWVQEPYVTLPTIIPRLGAGGTVRATIQGRKVYNYEFTDEQPEAVINISGGYATASLPMDPTPAQMERLRWAEVTLEGPHGKYWSGYAMEAKSGKIECVGKGARLSFERRDITYSSSSANAVVNAECDRLPTTVLPAGAGCRRWIESPAWSLDPALLDATSIEAIAEALKYVDADYGWYFENIDGIPVCVPHLTVRPTTSFYRIDLAGDEDLSKGSANGLYSAVRVRYTLADTTSHFYNLLDTDETHYLVKLGIVRYAELITLDSVTLAAAQQVAAIALTKVSRTWTSGSIPISIVKTIAGAIAPLTLTRPGRMVRLYGSDETMDTYITEVKLTGSEIATITVDSAPRTLDVLTAKLARRK